MANDKEVILSVRNLKQHFKVGSGKSKLLIKAVDDVSFDIFKGEVFSLVGESGCGKTTTGRALIKLYEATAGEVYFHGTRITSDVKAAKRTHIKNVDRINSEKEAELLALTRRLENGSVNQEKHDSLKVDIENKYASLIEESAMVLKEAVRDKKFEKIKNKDRDSVMAEVKHSDEHAAVLAKYALENEEIDSRLKEIEKELLKKIDEEKKKELLIEKNSLTREKKLNSIRKEQDLNHLVYNVVHKNKALMRKMQMIFQDPIASLNPRMTVKEIIAEGLRINGMKNEKEIDVKVKDALNTVGLVAEHASRYPHEFSGGQRQRIGIARALVVEPSFIVADEPISALDVSIRAQVINLLNELRETKGITILFIAHDLSVVKYFSERLAVMYYGHIVEMGDKDAIFNNPLHPYTLSLLSSIPLPDPNYEKNRVRKKRYNPSLDHDYSVDKPTFREVEPNHFVLCNNAEFERFQRKN